MPSQPGSNHGDDAASDTLDVLVDRIRKEIQDYYEEMKSQRDLERQRRAKDLSNWLAGPGKSVVSDIRAAMEALGPAHQELVRESLEGAIALVDIERSRDMGNLDNWDMILQLAEEMLFIVCHSLRSYGARTMGLKW